MRWLPGQAAKSAIILLK